MKLMLLMLALLSLFSCKKENLPDVVDSVLVMNNYCALGASTAAQGWQSEVASRLSKQFNTYAIPSACWTIDETTKVNLSSVRNDNPDNVMLNQVIRLLEDKVKSNYKPDLITILCGLNDQYYDSKGRFGLLENVYNEDIEGLAPQMWFKSNKADKIRLSTTGSMRFCIETLVREFPDTKIVIFTVQKTRYPENYALKLNSTLENIAQRYENMYLVDIYNESGIEMTEQYLGSDLIHLNSYGERILTNFLIGEIYKIFTETENKPIN